MLAAVALVHAQSENPLFDYLSAIRAYLDITPARMQLIARSSEEHSQWSWSKQLRLAQVQRELAEERAKNQNLLTGTQKAKLKTLEDALKLVPAIPEAQSQRILGEPQVRLGGAMFLQNRIASTYAVGRHLTIAA